MTRTIQYIINPTETNLSIKQYLKNKGYSSQNIIELKTSPSGILLNGFPVAVNRPLVTGDILIVCITDNSPSDKIEPVELPLDILYEDEDIIVINKPADMPIHPSMQNYNNTLANALAFYYECQNIPFVFRCINRLDRDTSGVTLIAKHYVSAGILSSQLHKENGIKREYLAICRGTLPNKQGTINAPIARKPGSVIERIVDFENGETAVTHYQTLQQRDNFHLLKLSLETGRTHQIRVHMKYLGCPLIGDFLYNPDYDFIKRQALHSYSLRFIHPITNREMTFTAPLPKDMKRIFDY